MLSLQRGTRQNTLDGRPRRSRGALVASVVVNVFIIGAFFDALTLGYHWANLVGRRPPPPPDERITFVPPRAAGPSTPGRQGGDGRPLSPVATRSRPIVAPRVIPSVVAPITRGTPQDVGGTGPVVGDGGPQQGIEPSYRDPSLWTRPGTLATAPLTPKQRIDSALAQGPIGRARDSILAAQAAAQGQRKPGDWTVKGPGGTWGIDDKSIHLGKIAVPNAVLALLSSKFQQNLRGNPIATVENRRMADVRRDLLDHAQMSMNEDDFRGAVKAIRARKDRERNERLAERRRAAEIAAESGDGNAAAPGGSHDR